MAIIVKGGGGKPEEEKTVTAGTSVIEVLPSSGKVMKKVTVNPTPTESKSVTPTTSELTVIPSEGKHLSQVVVGAVEDVTPEVTAQTPVITQILEGLVGKAHGANITPETVLNGFKGYRGQELVEGVYVPHGAYVWKKYATTPKYVENSNEFYKKVLTTEPQNKAITYERSSTYTFDESTGLFTLGSGNSGSIAYDSYGEINDPSNYYMIGTRTGTTMYKNDGTTYVPTLYNNADGVTILAYNDSHLVTEYQSELIYEKSDFVDFVISDSPTAYPDGGLQGDYWYEKVKDGIDLLGVCGTTKIVVDTFVPAVDTAINTYLNHSLGTMPKIAIVYAKSTKAYTPALSIIITNASGATPGFVSYYNSSGYFHTLSTSTAMDASQLRLAGLSDSDCHYVAGVEYTLITMA